MTLEQQRIAIAEWYGWRRWKSKSGKIYLRRVSQSQGDYFRSCGDGLTDEEITQPLTGVPDYLNDLNAMNEAEEKLTEDQVSEYGMHLNTIMEKQARSPFMEIDICDWHATAAQRAEALLRTIGRRTDQPHTESKVKP